MYSVDIQLPNGVSIGRFGMTGIADVLDYVRGAMKPSDLYGATVTIDGPTDAGVYMVAGSPSGHRKLYRVQP